MIDTAILVTYWPQLVRGTIVTLEIAALGCSLGITLGTLLGLLQSGDNKFIRWAVAIYATLLRGTPMLIQIAFIVFVLPQFGIRIPDFWGATLAIGLNSSAYVSQIIRSGIASIGRGQFEAAKVLGFNHVQTIRFIILPQAIRVVLPSLGNEFITLVKDSSLASTVGVMELSKQASYIKSRTFDALTVYCLVAVIYLTITSLLSLFVMYLEKRMNHHVKN
ncbi:MAG TPA: amino acid ABC transporter permease [Candidatus Limnocylindria bacterium]|nr:amino acid ABC transporter permease [Candidatus Limnocylindria bacterium]